MINAPVRLFRPDEQVLFDSDDEPEYLIDVVQSTMSQFEDMDMSELDRKMLSSGLPIVIGGSSEEDTQKQMDALYTNLNEDEKKTFNRLADEVLYNEAGLMDSCFFKKSSH